MKKRSGLGVLVGLIALLSLAAPAASFAGQAVYQVFLIDGEGAPVSAPVNVTVAFYNGAGSAVWTTTQNVVPDSGLCVVKLGSLNLNFNQPYYLDVQVNGISGTGEPLVVRGPGSYSHPGEKLNTRAMNIKHEYLDITE
ncbi:MAG: hypothetical protein HY900_07620 [Deltaproteobacteria bacterium]|nr:hypothetical protein [Deltaproteobacteria bacterium]